VVLDRVRADFLRWTGLADVLKPATSIEDRGLICSLHQRRKNPLLTDEIVELSNFLRFTAKLIYPCSYNDLPWGSPYIEASGSAFFRDCLRPFVAIGEQSGLRRRDKEFHSRNRAHSHSYLHIVGVGYVDPLDDRLPDGGRSQAYRGIGPVFAG
jgi:hypothetical protein